MPRQFIYTDRTMAIIEQQRGKYICPMLTSEQKCPIQHKRWRHGGCTAMMPISIGARLGYTLDRTTEQYKSLYRERTAVERINSQAYALGIERPMLRNGHAIANINTLIYILINLRFLQRLRGRLNQTK